MAYSLFSPSTWFNHWGRGDTKEKVDIEEHAQKKPSNPNVYGEPVFPAGRISSDEGDASTISVLKDMAKMATPSFRVELIPLIRDLYKVNPDMGIAVQDMYKLANTGHQIEFPNNTSEEAHKMREYLKLEQKKWAPFTAGIDGLVNKMIVQGLVSGAISFETVPNNQLDGIASIVFIKPENIKFKKKANGQYHPYQVVKSLFNTDFKKNLVKLNLATYKYTAMYGDEDAPYGVPPFLAALDSFKTQADMRVNFKQIMEVMGLVGFVEALMEKDSQGEAESHRAYSARLRRQLLDLKRLTKESLKDGIVAGYKDDHEFKLTSTTANLQNVDKVWDMNQQSVANGLGINGNIIGVSNTQSEGAAGTMLSKLISQLKNIQMMCESSLEFIYSNALLLHGFNNKGMKITFGNSTVTDDIKYQQGQEYKIRNNVSLYNQGIISQEQFAYNMGYASPDQKEPRIDPTESDDADTSAAKRAREASKDTSDRKSRAKTNTTGKRKDNDTKES